MIQKSLVLIKPDGVQRALVGEIIKRFENAGLKITGMKMVWIDADFSKKHYSAHVGKSFYPPTEQYITSGPVIAMVLEGIEAVHTVRKIVGSTEPKNSPPGTIRGDFAHMSMAYADGKKITIKNLIHASGTIEEAKKEIELWFKKDEIHGYKTVHEVHVL
ncbi:nucleoside-diphosphate kinase [Candidatus Woesearchaeota archaeon]|nr:nucleoside-diphosphate kinase [Candidatus Woesearchaeota archaeon]